MEYTIEQFEKDVKATLRKLTARISKHYTDIEDYDISCYVYSWKWGINSNGTVWVMCRYSFNDYENYWEERITFTNP